ncbi:hypothetical protein Vretifemale_13531, partial [Volvox reticuliferus]
RGDGNCISDGVSGDEKSECDSDTLAEVERLLLRQREEDPPPPGPSLRHCLLQQKLAVLDGCIYRRRVLVRQQQLVQLLNAHHNRHKDSHVRNNQRHRRHQQGQQGQVRAAAAAATEGSSPGDWGWDAD